MRLVQTIGAALMAVLAMGVVAATGATAHEFEFNKETGLLSVKGAGLQIFTTPAGAITCEIVNGHGTLTKAKFLALPLITVSYSGCFSSIPSSTVDQPISASYLFSADNGEVEVTKPILILVLVNTLRCHITVPKQKLSGITYDNGANKKQIEMLANVPGITSSGTGSLCIYSTSKTGKYAGNTIAEMVGAEMKWV